MGGFYVLILHYPLKGTRILNLCVISEPPFKKRIRVPVQRLVLILPVEEGDQYDLPGGKDGGIHAPPDEVSEEDQVANVKHISGLYDVVWDNEKKVYTSSGQSGAAKTVDGAAEEHVHGVGQHGGGVLGGDAGHVQEVCDEASSEIKQRLKCSAVLRNRVECRDFERKIYEEKCRAIDWKKIDEIFVKN